MRGHSAHAGYKPSAALVSTAAGSSTFPDMHSIHESHQPSKAFLTTCRVPACHLAHKTPAEVDGRPLGTQLQPPRSLHGLTP